MKKLVILLLVSLLLTSCNPSPQELVSSWQESLNKGDITSTLAFLAEDAVVTIIPAGPDGDGVYNGHAEIRGWYETIVSGKGVGTLSNCKVGGEKIACKSTYTDDGLKGIGVDFIEGDWVATVQDGKIRSYTFTISPESLAKFPPPPEAVIEPTIEPAPEAQTEVRLTSPEAVAGKWVTRSGGYEVWHEFRPDSTMTVSVTDVGEISTSPYRFENDLMTFEDVAGNCPGIIGKYEVYGIYEDDQLVKLRFVLVGEDACEDRRKTLNGKFLTRK